MAKRVHVVLEDDISGGTADETVSFGLDGSSYEIDLTTANAEKLRNALSEYVAHGRKVSSGRARRGGSSSGGSARTDREQLQAIREWARRNGYEVSDRGRISSKVVEAFNAAH
jgi:general stress protein YciG